MMRCSGFTTRQLPCISGQVCFASIGKLSSDGSSRHCSCLYVERETKRTASALFFSRTKLLHSVLFEKTTDEFRSMQLSL